MYLKNKKKKNLMIFLFAIAFVISAIAPTTNSKAEDDDMFSELEKMTFADDSNTGASGFAGISGVVGSVDSSGNILGVDYAVALSGGIIYSSANAYVEGAAGYAFISVMEGQFLVQYEGKDTSLGASKWTVTSGNEDATFMNVTYPYENQQATLYCFDSQGNPVSMDVTITGYNIINDY